MFQPSLLHHRSCSGKDCALLLDDTFGIFCWNTNKNNQNPGFPLYLQTIARQKKVDFLLFQEARFEDMGSCSFENFAFDAAANLEVKGSFYGVLTASKIESKSAKAYLSDEKEGMIGTHKSLLLSQYLFGDGTPLLILNIHAINFRESQSYKRELKKFMERIRDFEGPMIIAGDFNSWNPTRTLELNEFRDALNLASVPFREKKKIKSFLGNHLDFIFYRGLKLLDSAVFDDHGLSDHNPLYACFKKISK